MIEHEPIAWQQIEADGSERTRAGWVWADAPPVAGMRVQWALPAERAPGEPSAVAVAIAARVHLCGRQRANGTFDRRGGRLIDKRERYAESDPRSCTGAITARAMNASPPRVIAQPPIPAFALGWFLLYGGGPSHDRHPGTIA